MSRSRLVVATLALAFVASTQAPPTHQAAPAVVVHRTAAGAHFDPATDPVLFVLLIGSDVREGDPRGGRADSLQLLAVDTATGDGTIIGIPRDSYVPIPGRGSNKINSALYFGGPELQTETVAQLSGIPIHYWALIEFSRFRDLVDTLGGVHVEVPYSMADRMSGAFFDAGPRMMNGAEALAFSRNRYGVPGGDFGRSANQGRLLLAALAKFREETRSPLGLASYLLAFNTYVEANVPARELLGLATIGRKMEPERIAQTVLPGSPGSAGGASVVILSPGARAMFDSVRDDARL